MTEELKTVGDVVGVSSTVALLAGWLPPLVSFVTLVWFLIRIYETKTVQNLINKDRQTMATSDPNDPNAVSVDPLVSLPDPNVVNAPILAIRGQQAIGIPNVVTQTGKDDPDKTEMLFDPAVQQVQADELFTEEGKLLDTG